LSLSPEAPVSRPYPVADRDRLMDICGPHHRHLEILEDAFEPFALRAESQGGGIMLFGLAEGVDKAERALRGFEQRLVEGHGADEDALRSAIAEIRSDRASGDFAAIRAARAMRKPVAAQTPGQSAYIEALNSDAGLVFGIGPAGTGKTFLAVAAGVSEMFSEKVQRLIVARPAVEAGEKLGYLPGDLEEKVDPYMLPVWDSLRDLMGQGEIDRRRAKGDIEVAPLAFMRGRTLKNCFVVIDEAQNATIMQMKMLLTRLGRNSRMVVTGDPSQVDLPPHQSSGLAHALRILKGVPGVRHCRLTGRDVVRHELVSRIIDAYEADARES
jgi:phosphate starvation-inducible protein PhoH and related proteins